ncbi:hypothetical protein Hanom_Chr01g00000591 [Helianthus anomalus]
MGGTGLGWVLLQEAATFGWELAWVGSVLMSCAVWAGFIMGWDGGTRGSWIVQPFRSSRSPLVVAFSLFVWSLGSYFGFLHSPFCRKSVGDQLWCVWLYVGSGIIWNPGGIRQDWLRGCSFRCIPSCSFPPKPGTILGYRDLGTNLFLFCRWVWFLGWVDDWKSNYPIGYEVMILWVSTGVLYWALGRLFILCSKSYGGKMGISYSGQMKTPNVLRYGHNIYRRPRGKKCVVRVWYSFWSGWLDRGCTEKRITYEDWLSSLCNTMDLTWVASNSRNHWDTVVGGKHLADVFVHRMRINSRFICTNRSSLICFQLSKTLTFCIANLCIQVRLLEWFLKYKRWNGVLLGETVQAQEGLLLIMWPVSMVAPALILRRSTSGIFACGLSLWSSCSSEFFMKIRMCPFNCDAVLVFWEQPINFWVGQDLILACVSRLWDSLLGLQGPVCLFWGAVQQAGPSTLMCLLNMLELIALFCMPWAHHGPISEPASTIIIWAYGMIGEMIGHHWLFRDTKFCGPPPLRRPLSGIVYS